MFQEAQSKIVLFFFSIVGVGLTQVWAANPGQSTKRAGVQKEKSSPALLNLKEMARCLMSMPEYPKSEGFEGPVKISWDGKEDGLDVYLKYVDGQERLTTSKSVELGDRCNQAKLEKELIEAMAASVKKALAEKQKGKELGAEDKHVIYSNCTSEAIKSKAFKYLISTYLPEIDQKKSLLKDESH